MEPSKTNKPKESNQDEPTILNKDWFEKKANIFVNAKFFITVSVVLLTAISTVLYQYTSMEANIDKLETALNSQHQLLTNFDSHTQKDLNSINNRVIDINERLRKIEISWAENKHKLDKIK